MFERLPHEWRRTKLLNSKIVWHVDHPYARRTNSITARPLYIPLAKPSESLRLNRNVCPFAVVAQRHDFVSRRNGWLGGGDQFCASSYRLA